MTIPKVIHYCWFGRQPLPPLAEKCLRSWRKYLPDYEIKEWNEDNFNVGVIPYTQQAYEAGKYAYVSDYARFWILYHEGGLYFDTDVEVVKPLDDIIAQGPFMGMESDAEDGKRPTVAPGLGLGAVAGMPAYRELMEMYATLTFPSPIQQTIVDHTTNLFCRHGLKAEPGMQVLEGIRLYPSEYFNPTNISTKKKHITPHTRCIHHYASSWVEKDWKWHVKLFLQRWVVPEFILLWNHRRKVQKSK